MKTRQKLKLAMFGESAIYDNPDAVPEGKTAVRIARGKNAGKYYARSKKESRKDGLEAKREKKQPTKKGLIEEAKKLGIDDETIRLHPTLEDLQALIRKEKKQQEWEKFTEERKQRAEAKERLKKWGKSVEEEEAAAKKAAEQRKHKAETLNRIKSGKADKLEIEIARRRGWIR